MTTTPESYASTSQCRRSAIPSWRRAAAFTLVAAHVTACGSSLGDQPHAVDDGGAPGRDGSIHDLDSETDYGSTDANSDASTGPDAIPDATLPTSDADGATRADAMSDAQDVCADGVCCSVMNLCAGRCVNTTIDPANCGSCGNTCDGACSNGRCLVTLASGQYALAIGVDAKNVYWTTVPEDGGDGTVIMRVPIDGGNPVEVTSVLKPDGSTDDSPGGFAVHGTRAYWTTWTGTVMTSPLAGGAAVTLASGSALYSSDGLTVDDANVYWTVHNGGTVMSMPLDGGTPVTLASGQAGPANIAVDATNVYWSTGVECCAGDNGVETAPLDGGAVTILTPNEGTFGIAVNSAGVYWTEISSGAVMMAPRDGGAPVPLYSVQSQPLAIVADATRVYWVDNVGGRVMTVPAAGGTATILASGQTSPWGIAVDDTSVYWSTHGIGTGVGTVMKVTPKY